MPENTTPQAGYRRPPITEAIIGITFSSPINEGHLGALIKKFKEHYPHHQNVPNLSLRVHIEKGNVDAANVVSNGTAGHRLSTNDQTELIVLWPSIFTFSQLAPYHGWGDFIQRFQRDWRIFKRIAGFHEISRIGVRYINRIDVPVAGPVEYKKFVNVYPAIPLLPFPLDAFAVQTQAHLDEIGCILRINAASVESPLVGHASFLIDVDIGREINLPQNDQEIMHLLETIREKKNLVFEACITPEARTLFS